MNPTIKEVSAITILSARNWNAQPREAMISITGTGERRVPLKKGWAYTLRLCFDDIEAPRPGRKLFSDADADKVIDFLDKIEGKVEHVVVHCTHGLSRSPAIARYISQRCVLSNGFDNHMTFNRHGFKTLFVRWKHRVAPGEGFSVSSGGIVSTSARWMKASRTTLCSISSSIFSNEKRRTSGTSTWT